MGWFSKECGHRAKSFGARCTRERGHAGQHSSDRGLKWGDDGILKSRAKPGEAKSGGARRLPK